ncbi:MAG: ABC transporter permease subunit [Chloroflexota bacterium]
MTTARPDHHHAAVPPWRDVRVLRIAVQVVVVALVLAVGLVLWSNLTTSMNRSRLTFGLGFLDTTAGFEIAESPIQFSATDTYGRAFAVGLINTLIISVTGIALATILGVIVGVARLSGNWLVNHLAAGFVEVMRNTPLLVQLVLLYAVFLQLPSVANAVALPGSIYLSQRGLSLPRPLLEPTFGPWLAWLAVGIVVAIVARWFGSRREASGHRSFGLRRAGILVMVTIPVVAWVVLGAPIRLDVPVLQRFNFVGGIVLSPEFSALLFGLVIYTAAFIGEVVRGGIQSVRRGQLEAAYAVGLTQRQTLRLVVFPQALRVIVPPLTSQYLNLAKNSSLAIAIGFPDLFSVSRTMSNQTGQPVSVIVMVMATYLAISLATSLVMNLYNRRVQVLER